MDNKTQSMCHRFQTTIRRSLGPDFGRCSPGCVCGSPNLRSSDLLQRKLSSIRWKVEAFVLYFHATDSDAMRGPWVTINRESEFLNHKASRMG